MTQPYRCPVCNGNGKVPNGFYNQTSVYWSSTSTAPEICRSCNGSGIVWDYLQQNNEIHINIPGKQMTEEELKKWTEEWNKTHGSIFTSTP